MHRLVVFSALVALTCASPRPKIEGTSPLNTLQENNNIESGRSTTIGNDVESQIEEYLKTQEISFDLPLIASKVSLDARNLDNEELNFKLNFGSEVQARKKSKIKKIFLPILIFIMIKAAIFIPAALGILGLKAWNSMQLSFVSFVVAMGIAFWKMCAKVSEPVHPQLIHQPYYDGHFAAARSDDVGQELAYNSYKQ